MADSVLPTSLYIHFPYCLYKCHYCDFNSYASREETIPFERYTQALLTELNARVAAPQPVPLKTIFLGGGTPSLMPAASVETILTAVRRYFTLAPDVEITLEANPKTITPQKLAEFKQAGVNRVSVGIQSLHDAYLSAFGRIHSANDAREALDWVADAGFKSWNADLMFGFPGQKDAEWQSDLREIVRWKSPHLSCYSFTVEEEAPYGRQAKAGRVPHPCEETQARLFEWTADFLGGAGWDAYEISNFCKEGFESRHNLNYWNYEPFWGVGAGASAFFYQDSGGDFGKRTLNLKEPNRYMDAVLSGKPFFAEEGISKPTARGEMMMMGLRLKRGISTERFLRVFGVPLESFFGSALLEHGRRGWIVEENGLVRLTLEGKRFANQVVMDFLPAVGGE